MIKFEFFAKKHAKVCRIIHSSYPFYAYLTKKSTLTHLILRVLLVDNKQTTLTTYYLAVGGALLQ